jgi:hypothetical protein
VRDFFVESVGDKNTVLIGDDTGFLKKGTTEIVEERKVIAVLEAGRAAIQGP